MTTARRIVVCVKNVLDSMPCLNASMGDWFADQEGEIAAEAGRSSIAKEDGLTWYYISVLRGIRDYM